MRFITEFELGVPGWSGMTEDSHKAHCKLQLGVNVAEAFGWQNPVNGDNDHYKLEIEAFPMDKWMEFKQELNVLLSNNCTSWAISEIYKRIEELESFVR